MIPAIAEAYRAAWRFMLAFPLLFAVPVLIEFIQHVIEIRGGMYVDLDGARAAADDPLRLGWGLVKTLALTLTLFWMARYMAGLARTRVGAFEPGAVRLFLPVLGLQATLTVAPCGAAGSCAPPGRPNPCCSPPVSPCSSSASCRACCWTDGRWRRRSAIPPWVRSVRSG